MGYDSTKNRVYGYAQDLMTVLMTIDNGASWQSVDSTKKEEAKLLAGWVNPVSVPETNDANLLLSTPHTSYTQGTWGGKRSFF